MVLAELGGRISRAIQHMSNATIIDEKVLNECLNEITRALLSSDVQFQLVRDMQKNIKSIVNLDDLAAGHNKRRIIQQMLDPGKHSSSVPVGAVIVTKMDGHAKGGGTLSAVAATKSPVIFIGTGEHMDEFEVFDVKPFVSRLLGMGDLTGFMDKIHEVVPVDQQPELLQKLSEGNFMPRIITYSGPFYITELDSTNPKLMNESRMMRIARGAGRQVREVMEMLEEYKRLAKIWSKMKGLKIPTRGDMNMRSRNLNAQHE
ncbi:hypothetical protein SAY87_012292 [Trapa incisa]|uniref:SRP54-type proteins GTP-binding domain-containing protein n=1 Tax=Trapa incisa TaxID=236973 RepID=A0AAN7GNL8_9MYRT|nr:hypothetical protein SAY87_012292 [Trapa incisa]